MDEPRRALGGTVALLAATLATLVAASAGAWRAPGESDPRPAAADPAALRELGARLAPGVARRVARIRELRFAAPPAPRLATVADLRRIAGRELERPRVRRQVRAADVSLRLLGLLAEDESLADVASDATATAAAFYDPRRRRLFLVADAVPAGRTVTEFILAHELTHALEDGRFGLPRARGVSDDRALAESALVEGTATAVMIEYAARHLDPGALLAEVAGLDAGTAGLPRFALDEIEFAYIGGAELVEALRAVTGDWRLVDFAYQVRAPRTTEQVLHPDKYLDDERPLPVAPAPPGGPGWKLVDEGDVGEFATGQVLEEGVGAARGARAAAGWGGDSYRLWRVPAAGGGEACCAGYALAVRWRWDTARDARRFRRTLGRYAEAVLATGSRARADAGPFAARHGWAAVGARGDAVALGLAPTAAAARRIATP